MNEQANLNLEERERALRRFNWIFLYIPVAVLVVVVLGVTILLLALTFQEDSRESTGFVSAVADTVIIFASCNLAIVGTVILGATAAIIREKRQRKISLSRSSTKVLRRLQDALLQIDGRMVGASHSVEGIVLKFGGLASYIMEIFNVLLGKILRR